METLQLPPSPLHRLKRFWLKHIEKAYYQLLLYLLKHSAAVCSHWEGGNRLILLPFCFKETLTNVREQERGMLLAGDAATLLQLGFLGNCNQDHYLTQSCVGASAAGIQPGRATADLHWNPICQAGRNDVSKMTFQAFGGTGCLAGGTNRKEKTHCFWKGRTSLSGPGIQQK